MRILGKAWLDGYLDETLLPQNARIRVGRWVTLGTAGQLYFVRQRDPQVVWNYVRDIGVVTTVRKILSRTREALRNQKFVSCGVGTVLEVGEGSARRTGERVLFIAPAHPRCMERVVLNDALTRPTGQVAGPEEENTLRHVNLSETSEPQPPWVQVVAGWSPHSGSPPPEALDRALDETARLVNSAADKETVLTADHRTIRERTEPSIEASSGHRRAALVGLGNYAKTVLLPNVRKYLRVVSIHELDPTQLGIVANGTPSHDTSPFLRADEKYDAVFAAGFHHMHADVAVQALERGAVAVVEKPLATTKDQLARLIAAMRQSEGRLFACFQRRYLPFNAFIRSDLGAATDSPISYHATVFEVPLPPRHWYRWPTSASRLVSNGCHWIDHFLFLNGFCPVSRHDLFVAKDGTVNASLELANGALFTLVLTDRGSSRIGVQDHVELRCADATAIITNASTYRAERGARIVRSARCPKLAPYRVMYQAIAKAIATGSAGDSLLSVESSAGAVLNLEEDLVQRTGRLTSTSVERSLENRADIDLH